MCKTGEYSLGQLLIIFLLNALILAGLLWGERLIWQARAKCLSASKVHLLQKLDPQPLKTLDLLNDEPEDPYRRRR